MEYGNNMDAEFFVARYLKETGKTYELRELEDEMRPLINKLKEKSPITLHIAFYDVNSFGRPFEDVISSCESFNILERTGRKISLSEFGKYVLNDPQSVLNMRENTEDIVNAIDNYLNGEEKRKEPEKDSKSEFLLTGFSKARRYGKW